MSSTNTPSHVQGEGATTLPRRSPEETARLGDEIYERDIRPQVETDHHGEFVSIDVASGSWAVSDDLLTAAKRLREQRPDAIDVWSVQVGYGVIGSIGGGAQLWGGQPRDVYTYAADSTPLVGMLLLDGHDLSVQVRDGGRVAIQATG